MANSENLMDEIDLIVMHHVETIDNVFKDLKKALATAAATAAESSSSSENPNLLNERVDIAQQR